MMEILFWFIIIYVISVGAFYRTYEAYYTKYPYGVYLSQIKLAFYPILNIALTLYMGYHLLIDNKED